MRKKIWVTNFFTNDFLIKKNSVVFNKKTRLMWYQFLFNYINNPSFYDDHMHWSQTDNSNTINPTKHTSIFNYFPKFKVTPLFRFFTKFKKYNTLGKGSKLFFKRPKLKRLYLRSKTHSLNFSWFFRTQNLSLHKIVTKKSTLWCKRKRSFWPLDFSPLRTLTNYFYKKKEYKKSYLSYRKLKKNFLLNDNPVRGVWSFSSSFKAPRSSFSRIRNFNRQTIKIFWRSQSVFKKYFDESRHWTTRKFFHRFTKWLKRNRSISNSFKHVEFWQFIISVGLCMSKRTTALSLQSGLLYSPISITPSTQLLSLKNSILTISPQLISFLKTLFLKKVFFKRKFGKFQRTQYLNKASQWRSISKKKPKIFFNVFQAFRFNSWYFFFDFFSSSICFFDIYFNLLNLKPFIAASLPRHNLEKLNTFKLNI